MSLTNDTTVPSLSFTPSFQPQHTLFPLYLSPTSPGPCFLSPCCIVFPPHPPSFPPWPYVSQVTRTFTWKELDSLSLFGYHTFSLATQRHAGSTLQTVPRCSSVLVGHWHEGLRRPLVTGAVWIICSTYTAHLKQSTAGRQE